MSQQQDADNSSGVSMATIKDQKGNLELKHAIFQQQLHHLKNEGQFRISYNTGRILKYRPDKRTRNQIDEVIKELGHLNHARASLDIILEEPGQEGTVSRISKLFARDITVTQSGMQFSLLPTNNLQTSWPTSWNCRKKWMDMNIEKWLKETNNDAQLCLLRQALLDNRKCDIPLNYKLFKDEMSVDMGLIFVNNKLAVSKTLREWVLQVAHGDHLSADKMAEFTDMAHWPEKTRVLKEKAKSYLICFQAVKKLVNMLPQTTKNKLQPANFPF